MTKNKKTDTAVTEESLQEIEDLVAGIESAAEDLICDIQEYRERLDDVEDYASSFRQEVEILIESAGPDSEPSPPVADSSVALFKALVEGGAMVPASLGGDLYTAINNVRWAAEKGLEIAGSSTVIVRYTKFKQSKDIAKDLCKMFLASEGSDHLVEEFSTLISAAFISGVQAGKRGASASFDNKKGYR